MKKYKLAACGGTFDLFHKGHRDFLLYVLKSSEKIVVGITSDQFVHNKKNYESYEKRKKSVKEFLDSQDARDEIIKIDDIYGPTLSNQYLFDVLFVTEDSRSGADQINKKREELGLKTLEIIERGLYKTSDGKAISSTRIKNGEIDRVGNLYFDKLINFDFILPNNFRGKLSQPFGELIVDFDKLLAEGGFDLMKTVTVGDAVTKSFLKLDLVPLLSIIDLQINRKKEFSDIFDLGFDKNIKFERVENTAGGISHDLINRMKDVFESDISAIQIVGEDDLAVIPVVLSAPLGYEIYYGQPGKGVVRIIVTEEKKNEIKNLISKFERKVI